MKLDEDYTGGAVGRFFVTPTAVEGWQRVIAPNCTYNEALADIIDWTQDAVRKKEMRSGVFQYRTRAPLRLNFLVDETQQPKPAIIGIGRPHQNWRPV